MGQRKYRTKIEVLGDFLEAARQAPNKTRIIGLANLNPTSFRKYLEFCVSLELVRITPGGYRLTARAEAVLGAIHRVLRESSQTDSALDNLQKTLGRLPAKRPDGGEVLRYVSRIAWGQVPRAPSERPRAVLTREGLTSVLGLDLPAPTVWTGLASSDGAGSPSQSGGYLLPLAADGPLRVPNRRRPSPPSRE